MKLLDASVPKFLLVGVLNTLLSFVLMFLLEGLGYWPSTAIAYTAGAVLSFFLNRRFTFQSDEVLWRAACKFALSVAVCYLLAFSAAQPAVSRLLGRAAVPPVWQERLAKLAGTGFYTVINYFGQRFFAFRRRKAVGSDKGA